MCYVDATGPNVRKGRHSMFLPHEIVGAFYDYSSTSSTDLMVRLTGHPGVLSIKSLFSKKLSTKALKDYWAGEEHTAWYRNHPIFQDPPFVQVTISTGSQLNELAVQKVVAVHRL